MKLIITGSRSFHQYEILKALIEKEAPHATEILCGGARGADALAIQYAREKDLPLTILRPDYDRYAPKLAPLKRNTELIQQAEMVIAFYATGRERKGGTWDTVQKGIRRQLPVVEYYEGTRKATRTMPLPTLF